ncbi:MAG: hypothetical protein RMN52_12815 [Anaerolineae bacterium]|nr:hypothetical protein [Candidatus Roseilinea sp.]MDW8450872.1 hypothetical protein [Anaerolineae bacterium]
MEGITSGLIGIALGAAVLLLGKNLRLFAAAAGFLIGFVLTRQIFPNAFLMALIVAAILALIGVVLITVARGGTRLVLQIMGAVAGAGILLWLGQSLGIAPGLASWFIAFVGALIGFGLMARFFDLGIIALTSLLGASLIVNGLSSFIPLPDIISTVITLVLAAVGFFYQRSR